MKRYLIPEKDSEAVVFMRGFADGLAADPAKYHVDPSDIVHLLDAVDRFQIAYMSAANPATRTVPAVAAKNSARSDAEIICKMYIVRIKRDLQISDADKVAIGISLNKKTHTRTVAPTGRPMIGVVKISNGMQTLTYSNPDNPGFRRKPDGVTGIQIFRAIADEPVTSQEETKFLKAYQKLPITVSFEHKDDGKIATYYARWIDAQGRHGPWSLPTSTRIAA